MGLGVVRAFSSNPFEDLRSAHIRYPARPLALRVGDGQVEQTASSGASESE